MEIVSKCLSKMRRVQDQSAQWHIRRTPCRLLARLSTGQWAVRFRGLSVFRASPPHSSWSMKTPSRSRERRATFIPSQYLMFSHFKPFIIFITFYLSLFSAIQKIFPVIISQFFYILPPILCGPKKGY